MRRDAKFVDGLPAIIISADDVAEGVERGETEFQTAKRRFKEDHDLDFTLEGLQLGIGFGFQKSEDNEFFRIIWIGGGLKH